MSFRLSDCSHTLSSGMISKSAFHPGTLHLTCDSHAITLLLERTYGQLSCWRPARRLNITENRRFLTE